MLSTFWVTTKGRITKRPGMQNRIPCKWPTKQRCDFWGSWGSPELPGSRAESALRSALWSLLPPSAAASWTLPDISLRQSNILSVTRRSPSLRTTSASWTSLLLRRAHGYPVRVSNTGKGLSKLSSSPPPVSMQPRHSFSTLQTPVCQSFTLQLPHQSTAKHNLRVICGGLDLPLFGNVTVRCNFIWP